MSITFADQPFIDNILQLLVPQINTYVIYPQDRSYSHRPGQTVFHVKCTYTK